MNRLERSTRVPIADRSTPRIRSPSQWPVRKIYYNITITGLSVMVALVIGTIEFAGLLVQELGAHGSAPTAPSGDR